MRRVLPFLGLFAGLALAGCNSVNGQRALAPSVADVQQAVASPAVSRTLQTSVERAFGGAASHPPAEALLQDTLQDLIRASGVQGLPQTVILLDSQAYNAAALPNGQMFITRGMLALLNDRSELAAVFAHELGHVIARHSAQRVLARVNAQTDTANVARSYGDPEITRATATAHQQSLAAFSRDKELEADRIGIELLQKAGYDARATLRLLQGLDRMSTFYSARVGVARAPASPLATHPQTPERIAAARRIVETMGATSGRTERERYLAAIGGLSFGGTGGGGFVRGRSFLHRGLNIAITMPQGHVVRGFSDAVAGVKQGGKSVMIFRKMADGVASDPEGALRRLLARSTLPVSYSPLPGGAQGAMASVEGPSGRSKLAIVTISGKAYRLFQSSTAPDKNFDQDFASTLASLRNLTAQDERLARPHIIRIARADGPSALIRFAGQSGNNEEGLPLLLALNGLRSAADVRPGQQVKILELGEAPAAMPAPPMPAMREPELAAMLNN